MNPAVDFDPIAKPYRWMEYLTFGRALERCRTHYLQQLTHHRRALVLGDGDGRFCAALMRANPNIHVDAVDGSAEMLRLLEARVAALGPEASARLHTLCGDARTLPLDPADPYDLVASHFFLDCFTDSDLAHICRRVRPHLAPDATWVLSDFRVPRGWMRGPAWLLVRGLYLGFRILTGLKTSRLPDIQAALTAAALTRVDCRRSLGGLLTAELWQTNPPSTSSEQARSRLSAMSSRERFTPPTHLPDPVPNPEPASPSLPEPDPGVFHHEPTPPQPSNDKS